MIKDTKISTQFKLGLIIPMVFVVLLGVVAYAQSYKLYKQTETLYNHALVVERSVGLLRSVIYAMHRDMKDLSLDIQEKEINVELEWISWWKLRATGQIDTLYKEYQGDIGDIDTLKQDLVNLNTICEETVALMRSGKSNEVLTNTKTFGMVGVAVEKMISQIDKVNLNSVKNTDELYVYSTKLRSMLNKELILLVLLILILSLLVSFILYKQVINPIEELTGVTQRFSKGDMSARSSYKSRNELGVLANSFNNLAEWIVTQDGEKEKRNEELQAANKELESFSYSVSHDLRAPLRHINGYISILKDSYLDSLPEDAKLNLMKVDEASNKMNHLIDDLLNFSRTGRLEIKFSDFEMNDIISETVESIKSEYSQRNIEWHISELPQVYGDPALLRLVWINLINNAVKFTASREKAIIEIKSEEKKDSIVFSIKDNGVGFDMKYAYKLFGVFQRLHSSSEFEGTGVGLANVRRIISRHGGETWAESEVDKGSVFYFSLKKQKSNSTLD
jgi:signal transduction histidine kinase